MDALQLLPAFLRLPWLRGFHVPGSLQVWCCCVLSTRISVLLGQYNVISCLAFVYHGEKDFACRIYCKSDDAAFYSDLLVSTM